VAAAVTVWLGTAGWSYFPDWVGSFYPPGTQPADALARYVEAFTFVEIDSSFYAAPAPPTVERWAAVMPPEFRVSVKAPRELVQDTGLRPPQPGFAHFLERLLAPLHSRLARVVVQMPPSFAREPDTEAALHGFVARWATVAPLAIELRDPAWLDDKILSVLGDHGVVWVCNDLPAMPRAAVRAPASAAYVRLLGPHRGLDGKAAVQRPQPEGRSFWADRLAEWHDAGVDEAYVIVNNHYEGHAPATVRALAAELRERHVEVAVGPGRPAGQQPLF
jgi:uncharacterized protein YecE (DUF72 family)